MEGSETVTEGQKVETDTEELRREPEKDGMRVRHRMTSIEQGASGQHVRFSNGGRKPSDFLHFLCVWKDQ